MSPAPIFARPIAVSDRSAVGEARRQALAVAEAVGLDAEDSGRVSLIATELAVNLHLHGGGGVLLVQAVGGEQPGVQVLAIDRGPGMASIDRCLVDGYSTAGTAGQGLGSIKRTSDVFDVQSQPRDERRGGTVVLSQIFADRAVPRPAIIETGAVCIPIAGETVCGDGWAVDRTDGRRALLVADGLGHGVGAADAALVATRLFAQRGGATGAAFLTQAHAALRATRGAAVAIAELDPGRGVLRYAGLGNISGQLLIDGATRGLPSSNGTLGMHVGRIEEYQYPWPEGALVIMCSDGLLSGWTITGYPGIARRHPSVIAAILWRDWNRGRDDATVLVARRTAKAAA